MSTLKRTISKSITTLNMKTNNFVELNKCKTYIATLEEEIADLKALIGDTVYANWKMGNVDISDVEKHLTTIKEKEQLIKEQEERIHELQLEEQQVLGTEANSVIFCSMCGAKNLQDHKFCVKCGKQL